MERGVLRAGDDEAGSGGMPQTTHHPPTVTTEIVQGSPTRNIPHLNIEMMIMIMRVIMLMMKYRPELTSRKRPSREAWSHEEPRPAL